MKREKTETKISIKDRIALKITSTKTWALIYCHFLIVTLRIVGDITGESLKSAAIKITIAYFGVNFAQKAIEYGMDYLKKRRSMNNNSHDV